MALITLETHSDNESTLNQIDGFIQTWVGQDIEVKTVNINDITTDPLGKTVNVNEDVIVKKIYNISSIRVAKDNFTYCIEVAKDTSTYCKSGLSGFTKLSFDKATNELIFYLPQVEIVDDPYTMEPKPRSIDSRTKWIFKPI